MKEYYKKENLEKVVAKCYSLADVLRSIGLSDKGTNFKTIRNYIEKYQLDTSHFNGPTWNKGLIHSDKASYIKLKDILKENVNFPSNNLKMRLVKEQLKKWECEKCGISEWNGKPIMLELHHINGNHYDNRIENLQILCPNCHSQTDGYKNRKKYDVIPLKNKRKQHLCICEMCGKEFKSDRERRFCCRECYNDFLSSVAHKAIDKNLLKGEMIKCHSITELANKLNVSRLTIKKYLDKFNLLNEFIEKYADKSLHTKPIIQYDLKMNEINRWDSIVEARTHLNITSISKCLNGKRKTAGGYIWKYENED